MSYLVDSDWIVDYLKGRAAAVSLLDGLLNQGLAISIITFGEVQEGILFWPDGPAQEAVLQRLLEGVSILPLAESAMLQFAAARGELRRQGQLIGDLDLLIASTALVNNLTLVTRNRRHFDRVPGLELYQDS